MLLARELSQAELARRVKMDQSTINGLIKGEQRSTTKLHQIARELGTTPAYLNGETDDPASWVPPSPELDSVEREMVELLERLTEPDRKALLQVARSMAENKARSSSLNEAPRAYLPED